jgi:hypothetical protein
VQIASKLCEYATVLTTVRKCLCINCVEHMDYTPRSVCVDHATWTRAASPTTMHMEQAFFLNPPQIVHPTSPLL